MTTTFDQYLAEGCGRCKLSTTPDCKAKQWLEELLLVRALVLECGLTEEMKWGVPTYTLGGKNVVQLGGLKDYFVISFFKGALLKDPHGLLQKPGENSQAARMIKLTSIKDVKQHQAAIKAYVLAAKEAEEAGLHVNFSAKEALVYPEELEAKLQEDPVLKSAFEALTPGRKRSHILHISSAKQAKTRSSRVEKCRPKIMAGLGFNEYPKRG